MPSVVQDEMRKDDEVVETSVELVDEMGKEAEVPQEVVTIARPLPPLPQRLVTKTEDVKCRHFITKLKQHSNNVPLIEDLEQMPGYAKDMVKKKRSVRF